MLAFTYMIRLQNYIIKPQTGVSFIVKAGQFIKVIDIEGKQVADFFAIVESDKTEYFSAGVTLDCNANFYLKEQDFIYSNKFNKILQIIEDNVKTHDLIHPTCSQRMYEVQYNETKPHPSCHQNIKDSLKEFDVDYSILMTPFNIFMNTQIKENGDIVVERPISKPGDFILLKSYVDLIISVAACSVTQSSCNDFRAKPIGVEIYG